MIEQKTETDAYIPNSEIRESREDGESPSCVAAIDTLTQLARHKGLIGVVTGAAMIMGVVVSLILPPRYTSVTKIMPPKQTQSTTTLLNSQSGGGSLADMAGGGGLSLKDPNAIFLGLLKSRPIADAIISKFDLAKVYRTKDMTATRKELEEETKIVSEKSGLISISVTDKDKNRAADMANAYTDGLRVLSKTISVTEASKRRMFFENQLKEAKEDLIAAELSYQQIQQNKGLVHLEAQAGVIVGSLANVRAEIAAKQVELQALRSYSTEHNPDVQLTERELSTMQEEATRMEKHNDSSDFSDLGLKDVPKAGLDYLRAQRELQYRQAFFDLLLRQYQAARLDEAKDAAVIQIVESAIPADRKSSPHRVLIVLLITTFGFLIACCSALGPSYAKRNPELLRSLATFRVAMASK